eukprot:TRINITY_DN2294_c0_g1_i6.p1 TRINITY_DN2294_c0_g1~~TRINITY_DN2294_c0_g1_i6.p1  ORF type:complete len:846 (+),score=118.38 TRINITY_DN2294_c0_g1_i6:37-2538(+)
MARTGLAAPVAEELLLLLLLAAAVMPRQALAAGGDAQLVAAYNAALVEVLTYNISALEATFNDEGYTLMTDCVMSQVVYPSRVKAEGSLKKVLDSGVFLCGEVGHYSNTTHRIFALVAAQMSRNYSVTIKSEVRQFDNDTQLWQALDQSEIDCTCGGMGVGGYSLGKRRRVAWQTSCSTVAYYVPWASRTDSGISDYDALSQKVQDRFLQGTPTELGVYSVFEVQMGYQIFNSGVLRFDNMSAAISFMKRDPTMLGIIVDRGADDDAIVKYSSPILIEMCSFFRREVADDHKTNHSGDLTEWQQGNEQLALLYDTASIAVDMNGQRAAVLKTWNVSAVTTAECIAKQGSLQLVSFNETVGTLKRVLNNSELVLGDVRIKSKLMDTTVTPPTGPLHVLNCAIAQWITKEYELEVPLQLKYKFYNTTDAVFDALRSGEIDATSNYYYPGGVYINESRVQEFRPTCYSFAYEMFLLVRESDHITTIDELYERLRANPDLFVGAVADSNYWIMTSLLAKNSAQTKVSMLPDNKKAVELLSGGRSPNLTTILTEWMETPIGLRKLNLQQVQPLTTFFRWDIIDSCTDDEVDTYFGEECLQNSFGCSQHCKCLDGYHPTNDGKCEKKENHLSPKLVALVSLCVIFFVVFLVLAVIMTVVLLYLRKRNANPTVKEIYLPSATEESDGEPFEESYSTAVDMRDFNLEVWYAARTSFTACRRSEYQSSPSIWGHTKQMWTRSSQRSSRCATGTRKRALSSSLCRPPTSTGSYSSPLLASCKSTRKCPSLRSSSLRARRNSISGPHWPLGLVVIMVTMKTFLRETSYTCHPSQWHNTFAYHCA